MIEYTLHTTLPHFYHKWLTSEANENKEYLSTVLKRVIDFYIKNKELPEKNAAQELIIRKYIHDEMKAIIREQMCKD